LSFFEELKRRNVVRVGIAYGVAAWVLLQVSDLVLTNIEAPSWVIKAMMLIVAIGLIAALIIAWAYELTPEGIRKEADVDRSQSVAPDTGKKLDRIIIGFLVVAVLYFVWESRFSENNYQEPDTAVAESEEVNKVINEAELFLEPTEPSIAVLPFADMSPNKDQEYFSDGISEELLNLLVRVDGLKVASRTSSFAFKGSNLSLADIAADLKVDHVLEGSIRKADNRVRITAQLIDAATDRHLWSDTYDRELTDIFGIQDEIANAIVTALREELGMLENAEQIVVKADTENLNAYELYLKGRALFIARDQLEESIRLLETAVELDPGFARAWESLGAVYFVAEAWGISDRDYLNLAQEVSRQALELNPGLSMPWAVLSGGLSVSWADSFEYLDRALANDSKNTSAYVWRSIGWSTLGFHQNAIADVEACLGIDPHDETCRRHLAVYQLMTGNTDLALDLYQVSAERGYQNLEVYFLEALINRGDRLAAALGQWDYNSSGRSFPMVAFLDAIEFPERDHSKTLSMMLHWIEGSGEPVEYWIDALVWLGAYDLVTADMYLYHWMWFDRHQEWRQSPHFKQLYRDQKIEQYWREFGFPPQCRPLGDEDFECD
jgi:TolB-like protein